MVDHQAGRSRWKPLVDHQTSQERWKHVVHHQALSHVRNWNWSSNLKSWNWICYTHFQTRWNGKVVLIPFPLHCDDCWHCPFQSHTSAHLSPHLNAHRCVRLNQNLCTSTITMGKQFTSIMLFVLWTTLPRQLQNIYLSITNSYSFTMQNTSFAGSNTGSLIPNCITKITNVYCVVWPIQEPGPLDLPTSETRDKTPDPKDPRIPKSQHSSIHLKQTDDIQ